MKIKMILFFTSMLLASIFSFCQKKKTDSKGNLFIIGGGSRSAEFIQTLINTAGLRKENHIAILPMSSSEPDSSFHYIKVQLEKGCGNTIANLNFTKENINDTKWIDSLKKARLIFITGGDQSRFMNIVLHTPVYDAIHYAYANGATVAGTSAGAALMCRQMITGNELSDTNYHETFRKLHTVNIEFKEGLGLIESVIIDQHFVVRSRYNRLLSAIEKFPSYPCIGIDEATAIIVHGNKATVTGESQVVVLSKPEGLTVKDNLIKMKDLRFSVYTSGDSFKLK